MTKAGLLSLHRSVALVFAPLLLLQALTGATLVFRGPLARMLDPSAMTALTPGPTAPIAELAASAEARLPEYSLRRMYLPSSPGDVVFGELARADGSARFVSLDPVSARVLAAGPVWRFPLEAALRLHYRLLDGPAGLALVLANGIALTLLAASGLSFWWPGRGRALKSLAIRKIAPKRLKLRLWHRSCGVTISIVVLFSATTGVLLVAPDLAASTGAAGSGPAPLRSFARIDDAVAVARAQFPGAQLHDVRFPPTDKIDVNFLAPARNPRAFHIVSVSISRTRVLERLPAENNGILWMTVLPLHSGESFGLAGRLLLLVEAAVLVFLAISGPTMWWRSRSGRRRRP